MIIVTPHKKHPYWPLVKSTKVDVNVYRAAALFTLALA